MQLCLYVVSASVGVQDWGWGGVVGADSGRKESIGKTSETKETSMFVAFY